MSGGEVVHLILAVVACNIHLILFGSGPPNGKMWSYNKIAIRFNRLEFKQVTQKWNHEKT